MGNKKKSVYSLFLILIIITLISVTAVSCTSNSKSTSGNQVATVKRGSLSIDITGAGNLALSQTSDLAFETAGYVQEVAVSEGESVTKGKELAKLDTSEWDKVLETLNKALTTAQRNLTSKQRAYNSAVSQVKAKEISLRQAELDVKSAEYNFSQISSVKSAQERIDSLQRALDTLEAEWKVAYLRGNDTSGYAEDIEDLTDSLDNATLKMQKLLNLEDVNISTTAAIQIGQSQIKVEQSKKSLDDAKTAVEDAKTAVTDAQLDISEAEQSVKDAQSDLEEAKNISPIIIAPFDGFITKVNVEGGDEVQKGTVAMQIADPNKFKADITVGENDIVKVKEGGAASVQIDAISGITLPAIVEHISPTASIQQGVVSYSVTVEVSTLQAAATQGANCQNPTAESIQPSPTPTSTSKTQGPVQSGAGPNSNQGDSGTTSTTFPRSQRQNSLSQFGQFPRSPGSNLTNASSTSGISEIRAGMSVTVSIIVTQKTDILLVPNQVITYNGRASEVQIIKNGVIETRQIQTGINNWQYTEVIDGLEEGDQVVIPVTVNTAGSTIQPQYQQRQQITIPGSGGNIPGGGVRTR